MSSVLEWMNDQVLRMVWLNDLVGQGVSAVGLDPGSRVGGSVQFFVYDVIKIFLLLSVLIFAISYVQSHFPPERTRDAIRQDAPPKVILIRYEIVVDSAEPDQRLDLLHRNFLKYGTISNTLAAAVPLEGSLRRKG
jgi:hypothetical protein